MTALTSQQRADEFLSIWQQLKAMGMSPKDRDLMIDRMIAEEKLYQAIRNCKEAAK